MTNLLTIDVNIL